LDIPVVYCSVFLVILQTVFEETYTFYTLISSWGDSLVLNRPFKATSIMSDLQPLFDAFPALFVQLFFIWRIWTFCMAVYGQKDKLLVAGICLLISLLSFCAFISCLTYMVFVFLVEVGGYQKFSRDGLNLALVWVTATTVVDVMITVCMIIILYHTRATASSGESYDKISRLLRLTIQTGFLTSALAIFVVPFPSADNNIFSMPFWLLGKSYVITLLANLNSRRTQPAPGG